MRVVGSIPIFHLRNFSVFTWFLLFSRIFSFFSSHDSITSFSVPVPKITSVPVFAPTFLHGVFSVDFFDSHTLFFLSFFDLGVGRT